MIQPQETHNKIIEIIKNKGPSLPINIAKDLEMSSLFISAFLSELTIQKRIRVSNLKVGGSPLYFLEGQEEQLEPYHKYLHPKEAEAFLSLKKNNILKDAEQEPAIRVALRSIKDFAIGFKLNNEIYWRYMLFSELEAKELIQPKSKPKPDIKKEKQSKTTEDSTPQVISITKKNKILDRVDGRDNDFENPLIIPEKPRKQKPKSEFVQRTIEFIKQNNLKIIDEKEYKAKEYNCIIQIKSELGLINFYTQAKDKKTITETDFKKILSTAQSIPLPAFILYTGEISKKAKEYLKRYSSILKAKKIE